MDLQRLNGSNKTENLSVHLADFQFRLKTMLINVREQNAESTDYFSSLVLSLRKGNDKGAPTFKR
jgi:hypothetical protein